MTEWRIIFGTSWPTKQQSNSMRLTPSWELNSYATSQKIPHILWNTRFIAVFTIDHHMSLYWAKLIQPMSSYPLYFKSILISSFQILTGLSNNLIPSGFPIKILYSFFFSPICAPHPTHPRFAWYYHPTNLTRSANNEAPQNAIFSSKCYHFPLRSTYLLQCPVPKHHYPVNLMCGWPCIVIKCG